MARVVAWAAIGLVLGALVSGCARRQEIAQQTISTHVTDATGEAQSSIMPAALPVWTEVMRFQTGFEKARAVAVAPDGRILAAGDRAVRLYAADGTPQWEMPVDGEPEVLAVGADGVIYVGLRDRVLALGTDGTLRQTWQPYGSRTWVTAIVPTATELYIADAGNRTVWRYGMDGIFLTKIAKRDPARDIPALVIPSAYLDIALRPDGKLLVVNPGRHAIQVHSLPDGALVSAWSRASNGIEGFGGCCNPTDIALLPDGRIVTSEKGIPRVKVVSANGELLSVVAQSSAFDRDAEGIDLAVDRQGRVVVLDPSAGEIRLYQEPAPPAPQVAQPDAAEQPAPAQPQSEEARSEQ